MRLKGKVILVTGGGRGIGQAIVLRLASEGAALAVVDVNPELAEQTVDKVVSLGGGAIALRADVTNRQQVQEIVQRVVSALGGLDVAFNNAGVVENSPFLDLNDAQWDRMLAINAKGVFTCVQEEARQMIRQGRGGKIVNTASIAGRHGSVYQSHYSASKFAAISVTQSAARSLARYGITVNAMNPGIIETHMLGVTGQEMATIRSAELGANFQESDVLRQMVSGIPLGRLGKPADVAGLAYFLASTDSDYITGQAINVCGGMTMD